MKKLFSIIITIVIIQFTFSQEEIGKYYQTTVPLNLKDCKLDGSNEVNLRAIPSGSKFTIVNIIKSDDSDFVYIVNFWDWMDAAEYEDTSSKKSANKAAIVAVNKSKYETLNYKINSQNNTKVNVYFKMTASQLKYVSRPLIARMQPTAGTLILPLKFRFSPGDFSKDLTFSGTGGLRFNLKKNTDVSFSLIAGVGISSVTVDSLSTEGEIDESTDLAAATVLGGVLVEWKILQIGFFTGADWLSRKNQNNWCYQGKPWLGVGIGVSLFTKDKTSIKETNNN